MKKRPNNFDKPCKTEGATLLSEMLKANTTLTRLDIGGQDRRRHKKTSNNGSPFFTLVLPTANFIEERGAEALSEALKSNTTLRELEMGREYERAL